MFLAIDVQYSNGLGFVSAVTFNDWSADKPLTIYESTLSGIAEYESGQFYKRELPCLLKLLEEHQLVPELMIIDGYVTLGKEGKSGLGAYLYEALQQSTKIIGVAKRSFLGVTDDLKILRGQSKNPLFITSAGIDLEEAKHCILQMHGLNRIPTLLKLVDSLCRERAKVDTLI